MPAAIVAALVLILAAALRFWAIVRLLTRYRVEEYTSVPAARTIFAIAVTCVFVMLAALIVLAYCTNIRWVIGIAWMLAAVASAQLARKLYLRASGSYVEFYRARNWR